MDEPLYALLKAEQGLDRSLLDSQSTLIGKAEDWRPDSILGTDGKIDRLMLIL